jgi:hypothetical protein
VARPVTIIRTPDRCENVKKVDLITLAAIISRTLYRCNDFLGGFCFSCSHTANTGVRHQLYYNQKTQFYQKYYCLFTLLGAGA